MIYSLIFLTFLTVFPSTLIFAKGDMETMKADRVLGQKDFNENSPGMTQSRMAAPNGLESDGNHFFISEYSNRRILVYRNFPETNLAAADFVIGQKNFTSNKEELTDSGVSGPAKILMTSAGLLLTDYSFNRVTIYKDLNNGNSPAASIVIGQPDFQTSTAGTSDKNFTKPVAAASDGTMLFISDYGNNRILAYNRIPQTNGASADFVIGQPDFLQNKAGSGLNGLKIPQGVYTDGERLFIADSGNNRVLIYNKIPKQTPDKPDLVLGQPDFTATAAGTDRGRLHEPDSILVHSGHLFISDLKNHRVLIWKKIPETSGAPADFVLGQKDFTSGESASGPDRFFMPRELLVHNDDLYVADRGNNRILIFSLDKIFKSIPE